VRERTDGVFFFLLEFSKKRFDIIGDMEQMQTEEPPAVDYYAILGIQDRTVGEDAIKKV
jgi:hypothetical protein